MKRVSIRNSPRPKLAAAIALAVTSAALNLSAQHIDINAGAASTAQNQPLRFNNGSTYNTNSLYVRPLVRTNSGTFAGYYFTPGVTFTGVGTGLGSAAAPGTQIRLRFVSVAGPEGGSFGVWDVPGFNPSEAESTSLAFSVPVGTTNGTNSILISENDGTAGADPYGHIHGRNFTATRPGLYVVGMQLYDAAKNGSGGGPIHSPSAIYPMYFQAGVTIADLKHNTTNLTVNFASQNGKSYYLQTTGNPAITNSWTNFAGPFTGSHLLRTVTDTNVSHAARLYRLRVTTP
jgi:hypothetical protein